MTRIAGGDRIEDIETLRADKGFVDSLGWEQIAGADAYTNFINNKRNNEKNRIVNEMMAVKSMRNRKKKNLHMIMMRHILIAIRIALHIHIRGNGNIAD